MPVNAFAEGESEEAAGITEIPENTESAESKDAAAAEYQPGGRYTLKEDAVLYAVRKEKESNIKIQFIGNYICKVRILSRRGRSSTIFLYYKSPPKCSTLYQLKLYP